MIYLAPHVFVPSWVTRTFIRVVRFYSNMFEILRSAALHVLRQWRDTTQETVRLLQLHGAKTLRDVRHILLLKEHLALEIRIL